MVHIYTVMAMAVVTVFTVRTYADESVPAAQTGSLYPLLRATADH